MKWWLKFLLVFIWLMLLGRLITPTVYAEARDVYTDTIDVNLTDWNDVMSFPKFDPTKGILTGIEFSLDGTLQGSADFESLDAKAITVTIGMGANVELQRPDGTLIYALCPIPRYRSWLTALTA